MPARPHNPSSACQTACRVCVLLHYPHKDDGVAGDAVNDVIDGAEDVGDDVGNTVEDIGDDVEDAVDDTTGNGTGAKK